jgi:hypothetical protein
MMLGAKDPANKKSPSVYTVGNELIERKKIDWVTKKLGYNEDFIKIETIEEFTYNYKDGVPFVIY